jgi:hypothetical protein
LIIVDYYDIFPSRRKRMMKRALWLLCGAGVMIGLFLSCEIPQSVTIKGKPGVYIPLGDPLKGQEDRLEDYVSIDKIRDMMDSSDADKKIAIYDYRGSNVDSKVQAYIAHYPIAQMQFDLEAYIRDSIEDNGESDFSYTLPPLITNTSPGSFPPDGYYLTKTGPQTVDSAPLFTISLNDMAKLVEEVTGGPFGIELDFSTSFQNNLRVYIPAFGFTDYQQGIQAGNKLRFANTPVDGKFIPKRESLNGNLNNYNELEIYVKVIGSCSGTIAPEIVFEWETATVHTIKNESLKGEYQFNFKEDMGEFLGDGVNFKNVTGYIYVNNVGDEATLSLSAKTDRGDFLVELTDELLKNEKTPEFPESIDPFTTTLPEPSLAPISLANVLSSDSMLEYQIKIPVITIRNEGDLSLTITIDMVILLPLEFEVSAPSPIPGYAKLELKDMFPEPGKDDLFLRDSEDDGLLSNLASMTILFKKFQNDIIGGNISILISIGNFHRTFDFKQEGKLMLNMKDLPYPFTPEFGIVIQKDNNQPYGTLFIKRQTNPATPGKFEFTLAVEAKADLNYTIDL